MKKTNILIISIYYPPTIAIASYRIEAFAKYLDPNKYNVFVHTIGESNKKSYGNIKTSRDSNHIWIKPLKFNADMSKMNFYFTVIYNYFISKLPLNEHRAWIKNSLNSLPPIIENNSIDILLSSYSPTAPHILALELKKRFPALKWIADMRDEMSRSIYLNKKERKKLYALEQAIFENANAVTSVSKPLIDEFASLCKNKQVIFDEIRNGFDFISEYRETNNDSFVITYIGTFYFADRSPNNFLQAMVNITNKNKNKKFFVRFIGIEIPFEIPIKIKDIVEIIPSVPYVEAIEYMNKSDALLMIHPTNNKKGMYTGKLFDYLGALKPILALIDEKDVAANLIRETNSGYIVDNADIDAIEQIILKAYSDKENGVTLEFNRELIHQHHRKEQVKRVDKLIERLMIE